MTPVLAAILLLWPSGESVQCQTARMVDGDTFIAGCDGWAPWPFRLHGADAPELRGGLGALASKLALEEMMASAPLLIAVVTQERDGFGRVVVRLMRRNGTDLSCDLIASGHAVEDVRYSRGAYAECGR